MVAKYDGTCAGPLKSKELPGMVESDIVSQAASEDRGWCESIQSLPWGSHVTLSLRHWLSLGSYVR